MTYAQDYYNKNKQKIIARQLEYYRAHRERCLEYFRRYNKTYHLAHYTPLAKKPTKALAPKRETTPKKPKPQRAPAPKKEPTTAKPKRETLPRKVVTPRKESKNKEHPIPTPPQNVHVPCYEPMVVTLIQRGHFVLSFA